MTRALVKRGSAESDTAVVSTQVPSPGAHEVLIRTEAVGLCGSDVHAWRQDAGYEWVQVPVILGHEAVGIVADIGDDVDPGWLGKRVVPVSIDGCGRCPVCQSGRGYICPQRSVLGLSFDGAAAEACVIAVDRLVEVAPDVSAHAMVLVEPLAIAVHAVSRLSVADPSASGEIIVTGPGPIGLMAALILHQQGHRVTLVGTESDLPVRLSKAESLGLRSSLGDSLPAGISLWLEASGSSQALATAIENIDSGGTIVVPALFARIPEVDVNLITRREIGLIGSYGASRSDYAKAAEHIGSDPHFWEQLVSPFLLSDASEVLGRVSRGEVIKAILIPESSAPAPETTGLVLSETPDSALSDLPADF
ncbi:alcohol dehydrogenase catalytic domain-containing protein [Brevibacterium sp. 'Marine']|uniref:zinc-dependent alcohol dehydrogenase n=1 Tax=Brevibacterium sp. 'Marine' TaxID=2725563 RepID=UPI00145ED736|nr:alcohol dehydrogenase catalytic domain-containing protein [Brevibacterium sp. 'Marine']